MSDRRDEELYADRGFRPGPPPELREPPRRRSRALGVFVATFALAAFAGVVWYAYDQGLQRGSETTAPLIKADPRPAKVRPEQPGGLQVPNQDKLVYEAMRPGDGGSAKVERLLPPPEKPVDPPAPPPPPPVLPRTSQTVPPSAEVPVPPATTSEPADTGIPPARIVTPAPVPVVPQQEASAPPPPPPPALAPAPVPLAPAPPPAAPAPTTVQPAAEPQAPAPTQAPASQPAPVKATPSAGSFRIQLGALRDEAAAEGEWTRLKKRYAEELGTLDRRIQRVDLGASKGVFFRIQSSGVSEASAESICAALKPKGQPCIVVRP
ncbi:SPOR domain-containing protein [Thalassobaculum sp.]|uniref:SPOR domain-containing protein n=1 Tax=Thalassobaculum sp. TaxID=2022740 RepID=UPI0032EB96B5